MATPFLAGLAVSATALGLRYALRITQKYQATTAATARLPGSEAAAGAAAAAGTTTTTMAANYMARLFRNPFEKEWYKGGFEPTMTKKEAGLILGVRESSSPEKIRKAYMTLININHPDRGGSSYIAGKINEAKEILLKNAR